jgi:hypothetical protein
VAADFCEEKVLTNEIAEQYIADDDSVELGEVEKLNLSGNQLTDVSPLKDLTQLKNLRLYNNPDLTKAQIDQLQKALPNCGIIRNDFEK